jgi:hypothetical protein
MVEAMGRRVRRRKPLLDDLKQNRRLKLEQRSTVLLTGPSILVYILIEDQQMHQMTTLL